MLRKLLLVTVGLLAVIAVVIAALMLSREDGPADPTVEIGPFPPLVIQQEFVDASLTIDSVRDNAGYYMKDQLLNVEDNAYWAATFTVENRGSGPIEITPMSVRLITDGESGSSTALQRLDGEERSEDGVNRRVGPGETVQFRVIFQMEEGDTPRWFRWSIGVEAMALQHLGLTPADEGADARGIRDVAAQPDGDFSFEVMRVRQYEVADEPGMVDYVYQIRASNRGESDLGSSYFDWEMIGTGGWREVMLNIDAQVAYCEDDDGMFDDFPAGETVDRCITVRMPADVDPLYIQWFQVQNQPLLIVDLAGVDAGTPIASPEATPAN